MENITVVSVSQINQYVKDLIDAQRILQNIYIRGEIANFTNHAKTGHLYFTLKDDKSSIRAIMWSSNSAKLKFEPQNGMNVIVLGRVQAFMRDGVYQIYCDDIQPDGVGELYVAFEQLKEKLSAQGLFDQSHKKPLPEYPQKIGVVTAKTGAAFQDIINVISRRYPIATIALFPALVQGDNAPESIVEAIENANTYDDIDVLIVGRGGGSSLDLWCFNDEKVAWAIYNSKIPVVSAVGHEVDYTISDFVADFRAPTPSAAAELVTPDMATLDKRLKLLKNDLYNNVSNYILTKSSDITSLKKRIFSLSPQSKLQSDNLKLDILHKQLASFYKSKVQESSLLLDGLNQALQAFNPLKVLTRGYSITYNEEGKIISKTSAVKNGDIMTTKLTDGEVLSEVIKVKKG